MAKRKGYLSGMTICLASVSVNFDRISAAISCLRARRDNAAVGTNEILPNVGNGHMRRCGDHVRIELTDQVNFVKQAIDMRLKCGHGSVFVVLA